MAYIAHPKWGVSSFQSLTEQWGFQDFQELQHSVAPNAHPPQRMIQRLLSGTPESPEPLWRPVAKYPRISLAKGT